MQSRNIKVSLDITVDYIYYPDDKFIELYSVKLDEYPEAGNVLPILTDEDHDKIINAVDILDKEWGEP
jgi:hypothetical protein